MTVQGLIELFRKQVDDVAAPYLWDDEEVLQYLIDAQDTFVRELGGIADASTAAITEVNVVANTPLVAHSPYILRIRSAKLLTSLRPLKILNEADLALTVTDDYGIRSPMYLDDTDRGTVTAMVLGVENNKIRWLKVPATDATTEVCKMNVFRLPYPRIEDQEDTLEIDEQHHIHLLLWMKHLAYAKPDAETYDPKGSESMKEAFMNYCERASKEKARQSFRPRVVHYNDV